MTRTIGTSVDWSALNAALATPFEHHDIKYRAGAVSRDKRKAQALAYVDPRCYEDRLNKLVPGAWQVEFEPWGHNRIICRLTIHNITRSSTGESNDNPNGPNGTTAEAQAFKRACAKFGLGRHLYTLEPTWAPYDPDTKRLQAPQPRQPPRQQTRAHNPTSSGHSIGPTRAAKLRKALADLGVHHADQLSFARSILQSHVRDLAELDEEDATTVWKAAGTQGPRHTTGP